MEEKIRQELEELQEEANKWLHAAESYDEEPYYAHCLYQTRAKIRALKELLEVA